jgi:type III restriction enzyme
MSLEQVVRALTGRLSLREPQAESLRRLHEALESVPALRDRAARSPEQLAAMVNALQALFPSLSDFERDFPSLCFALATGVGKTRLMGAFISYLHAAYGYRHFFVLAPNLTIYDKLIQDFTPNTPKYVFKGISEFAANVPQIVTGDTYEQAGALSGELYAPIQINIFNISKINSEVRGGREPRIKRLWEVLGQSYFDYLAALPDLVLIMDESHRYRASAGIRALNELRPLLGLELTATPFTEAGGNRQVPFRNVVMDYPLARAIEDGFVKEPAVVTQQNFDPSAHSPEALEGIKLMDGVRVHEETKVHLLTYAQQSGEHTVKPFMLVIARDITHAARLMALVESDDFFSGRYRGKAIQVDSSQGGEKEEEMIRRLLAVESFEEPTEIVIHVNMLKEGWDVTNLYTIVPLRAANARTLIEQSIGRGLRLPYGRKTGVEVVDRLNIIAHDRFQEVIDEAGRGDSPIRMKTLKLDPMGPDGQILRSVVAEPTSSALLGLGSSLSTDESNGPRPPVCVNYNDDQKKVAQAVMVAIGEFGRVPDTAPTSASLASETLQAEILRRVEERLLPKQLEMLPSDGPTVRDIVRRTVQVYVENTIDIPRIAVIPKGPVKSGYRTFTLDVSRINFQPQDQQLLSQALQSGTQVLYGQSSTVSEHRPEDYIVRELVDFDDVSYDEHSDLLYRLAGQAVGHFKSYLTDPDELDNVLAHYGKATAEIIHGQMAQHYFEESAGSEVRITGAYAPLKTPAFTATGNVLTLQQTPPDASKIAQYLFGGFKRCAYTFQKFHSNTERILASVLERDAQKWFRPVAGQFGIYYRLGADQPEYIPDFVAATDSTNLILETKMASEMDTPEVLAKSAAAMVWCGHATDYSMKHGGKPWRYVLIPHDEVAANVTLGAIVGRFTRQ